jgi:hypothetical protein
MPTHVYVDGFNLYYGALKGTPYKWLDLGALCRRLVPRDDIRLIRYFTARVSDRPHAPGLAVRQDTYLRALAVDPSVQIHFGQFKTGVKRMPRAPLPTRGRPSMIEVVATEEKGSDVNLASYLLLDALRTACDTALVVTNDSDLATPIRLARQEAGMTVGVVNPHPARRRSLELRGSFFKQIRRGDLRASQFPDIIEGDAGRIRKPKSW